MTRYEFLKTISSHFDEDNLMEYFDENGERNDCPGWLLVDPLIEVANGTWNELGHCHEDELMEGFVANMNMLANCLSDVAYSVSTVVDNAKQCQRRR